MGDHFPGVAGSFNWRDAETGTAHRELVPMIRAVMTEQVPWLEDMKRQARMYRDRPVQGFDPGVFKQDAGWQLNIPLSYNVVRICVDTMVAKIAAHSPMPKFLTNGGTQELQDQARTLEKYTTGLLRLHDGWKKAGMALRDAALHGMGLLKVYARDGEIHIERVHPSRIVVDDQIALDLEPREMHQVERIPKSNLLAMFPDHESGIEAAQTGAIVVASGPMAGYSRTFVDVFETWALADPWGRPGRHTICVDGDTLIDEEWESKRFPFAVIRHTRNILGWMGIGLGELLEGIQTEVTELAERIRLNMRLLSVPFVLKHVSSNINDEHLMSDITARLVEWDGQVKPEIVTPPAVHPQIFEQLENLYKKAFEVAGISQMSASSLKPAGLNSGIALRTYLDVETQRLSQISKEWEQMFVDVGQLVLECAKSTKEKIRWVGKGMFEDISLSNINANMDDFVLQVYPASSLPQAPAARLERIVEMSNANMVTPGEARELLDMPDLEKADKLANAGIEDLQRTFEYMLRTGEYISPMPLQDLETGMRLGVSYWLRAKMAEDDEDKMACVARWVAEAQDMMQKDMDAAVAKLQPPAGPGGPAPIGAMPPGPPPAPNPAPMPPVAPTGAGTPGA